MQALRPFQGPSMTARPRLRPCIRLGATAGAGGAFSLQCSRRIMLQWSRLHQFRNFASLGAASGQAGRAAAGVGRSLRMAPQRASGDSRGRPGAGGGRRPGIVWFRGDLRLHDHEALTKAQGDCSSLLPVYCFDPRDYQKSPQGYERTGPYRATFLLDAVADLRARLRAAGSELVVRLGRPEEVVPELMRLVGAEGVYAHGEVTYEGKQVEAQVQRAVEGEGGQLQLFWANTLHHLEDLPFRLPQMPQNFDQWRECTAGVAARAALEAPAQLRGLPLGAQVEAGDIPTLKQLGLERPPQSSQDPKPVGGESEALRQLRTFLSHARGGSSPGTPAPAAAAAGRYGARRAPGAACGSSFASNIAPWLATGCLSPRYMHEEAQRVLSGSGGAAGQGVHSSSSGGGALDWVNFELLWRDFFRFITLKYTNAKFGAQTGAGTATPALAAA